MRTSSKITAALHDPANNNENNPLVDGRMLEMSSL